MSDFVKNANANCGIWDTFPFCVPMAAAIAAFGIAALVTFIVFCRFAQG